MTIDTLRREGHAFLLQRSGSAARDADILLSMMTKQPREYLIAHGDLVLSAKDIRTYHRLLRQRREGVPLAYLTKQKEFLGREFIVTPAVLVPRPETEALAEAALHILLSTPHAKEEKHHSMTIVDIGTGSGILAVTLAAETPRIRVVAVDCSGAALTVARRNARRHRVLRQIVFFESDLLREIPPEYTPTMIVANLPYVRSDDLKQAGNSLETRGLLFEPPHALDGGPDGLYIIRRFFFQLQRLPRIRDHLTSLLLEHAPQERGAMITLAQRALPTFQARTVTPFVTVWERA